MRLRVGVVGAGWFGRLHYEAWSRLPVELVALAEPDPARARAAADAFGAPAVYADAATMAAQVRPDLVDIVAPPAAHLEAIRAALPCVRFVICQKPFCRDLGEAERAVAEAEAAGVRLAVHENFRFQPWHRAAKAAAPEAVGAIRQIAFRLRPGDGRGPRAYLDRQPYFRTMPRFLLRETGVHLIDLLRFLLGEPESVYADLRRLNPAIAGEDAGHVLLGFPGGARGLIDADRHGDHPAETLRRTLGTMRIEGERGELRLDGDGRLWARRFLERGERPVRFDWEDRGFGGDCVHLTCRALLWALLEGRPAETEARDYLRNLRIEAAAYESAATGRRVPL